VFVTVTVTGRGRGARAIDDAAAAGWPEHAAIARIGAARMATPHRACI
jgi:hypothetical protein